jgi:hypothetical protein
MTKVVSPRLGHNKGNELEMRLKHPLIETHSHVCESAREETPTFLSQFPHFKTIQLLLSYDQNNPLIQKKKKPSPTNAPKSHAKRWNFENMS